MSRLEDAQFERFDEVASGATALQVAVDRGDLSVRVASDATWTIEYESSAHFAPQIERDGDTLRVHASSVHSGPVRITAPREVRSIDLQCGAGQIEAEGIQGRAILNSSHGAAILRAAGGEADVKSGHGSILVERFEGRLQANSGHGNIRVANVQGQATLHSGNGRVEAVAVEGRIRATTGNGEVVLERIGGEAEANSGLGSVTVTAPHELKLRATSGMGLIRVTGGSARELYVRSNMGKIITATDLLPGLHELETDMGSIDVTLPATTVARIEAQTTLGRVESDFPLVRVGRSGPMGFGGGRMVGSIGEGEPRADITLRSSKGSVTIRRSNDTSWPHSAEYTAPEPKPAAAPSSGTPERSTLAILEALSRGEITPAEAEDLLSHTR